MSWAVFEPQAAVLPVDPNTSVVGREADLEESGNSSKSCVGTNDWQNFESDSGLSGYQWNSQCSYVLKSCFDDNGNGIAAVSSSQCGECFTDVLETSELQGHESDNSIFCKHRVYQENSPHFGFKSCPVILSSLHEVVYKKKNIPTSTIRDHLHLDLPAECNDFDWDTEGTPNESISPILFRPGQPESPLDLEFDHKRASLGLATLSESELTLMCQEMERKFTTLSESLVSYLQSRDRLVTELSVKNKLISSILKVESLKHSGVGDNAGRTRSKSLRTKPVEDRVNGRYLSSIIPYCPPEGENWNVTTLLTLSDILNAIAEDSENVPALVAEYLQNEVLR